MATSNRFSDFENWFQGEEQASVSGESSRFSGFENQFTPAKTKDRRNRFDELWSEAPRQSTGVTGSWAPEDEDEENRQPIWQDVFNTTLKEGVVRPAMNFLETVTRLGIGSGDRTGGGMLNRNVGRAPGETVSPARQRELEQQSSEALEQGEQVLNERVLPVDREYAESFVGKLNAGGAQFAGQAATRAMGGPAGAGALMVAQMFDEGYEDAFAKTGDRDKAMQAGLLNTPAAGLDYLGLSKSLKPLFKSGRAPVKAVQQAAKGFLSEGVTEGAQDVWQNVVAKDLAQYEKERQYIDRETLDSFLIGGIIGGVGGGVAGIARGEKGTEKHPKKVREQGVSPIEQKLASELETLEETEAEASQQPAKETPDTEPESPVAYRDLQVQRNRTPELRSQHGKMNRQVIEQDLGEVIARVSQSVPVQVVETVEQLPPSELRVQALEDPDAIGGSFDPNTGRVYLVASNLKSTKRARQVLLHESLGHYGARAVLGREFVPTMEGIYNRFSGDEQVQKLVKSYGFDVSTQQGRAAAGDELVARVAENRELNPTLWDEVVEMVRTWAAKAGLIEGNDAKYLQDAEIGALLKESRRKIVTRKPESDVEIGGVEFRPAASQEDLSEVPTMRDAVMKALGSNTVLVRRKAADSLASMEAVEKVMSGTGKAFDAAVSAWKGMLMTRNLNNVVRAQVDHGAIDYDAQGGNISIPRNRKGLKKIFKPVAQNKADLSRWENWAKVQSARERAARRGKDFESMNSDELQLMFGQGFNRDFVSQAEALTESQRDTYQKVFDGYHEFQGQLLDTMQKSGMITREQREGLSKVLNYVPFQRNMSDVYREKLGGARSVADRGVVNQTNPVRGDSKEGSNREINPIMENIINQLSFFTDAAMKNLAGVKAMNILEAAGVAEKVGGYEARPVRIKTEEVTRKLNKLGANLDMSSAEQIGDALNFFTLQVSQDDNIVSVSKKGKREFYRVEDPGLLRALNDMGPEKVDDLLTMSLNFTKRVKTNLITTTPEFAIANTLRDTLSTWVMYGEYWNPFPHIKRVAKGLKNASYESDELRSMQAMGAGGTMHAPITKENVYRELTAQGIAQKLSPVRYMGYWERVLSAAENANRLAVREKVLKNGGSEAEANFQAMDLLNFSMRPDSKALRVIGNVAPFFNAGLQGSYKLVRQGQDDPKRMLINASMLAMGSLALMYHNYYDKDEEGEYWFRKIRPADKELYYHIRISGNNIIRIPKPFELGAVFSSMPEVTLETMLGDQDWGQAAEEYLSIVWNQVARNPLGNPMTQVPIEQWANQTIMFGSEIEPEYMGDVSPKNRYREDSGPFVRKLGELTNISPERIEAGAYAIAGGISSMVLGAADMATAKIQGKEHMGPMRLDQYPVVGRFYRDSRTMATKYANEFYDLRRDLNEVYNDAQFYRQKGMLDKISTELDRVTELSVRDLANAMNDRVSANRRARRKLRSLELSAAEVKRIDKQLLIRENKILSETEALLEFMREGVVSPFKVAKARSNIMKLSSAEKEADRLLRYGRTKADVKYQQEKRFMENQQSQ